MFADDTETFLADFGVPCMANGVPFTAIFDQPDEDLAMSGLHMQSTGYLLTASAADVSAAAIVSGVAVTVAGVAYAARTPAALTDGVFVSIPLTRI